MTNIPPEQWNDEQVKRDLRATVRLNLAMAGVWLTDAQLVALVDAFLARLSGELRARRIHQFDAKSE